MLAGVVDGQVNQHHEPAGALDERADRGQVTRADDEVTCQWSGTARSRTPAGRSLIISFGSMNRGWRCPGCRRGLRTVRPVRRHFAISRRLRRCRQAARAPGTALGRRR